MNKKGFTTVELIVSFTLISVIVFFLFEIIMVLKTLYVSTGIKTKMLTKQAILAEVINQDFIEKNLIYANKCSDTDDDVVAGNEICVDFAFEDRTRRLTINRTKKTIRWDNVTTELISGSTFGNINITAEGLAKPNGKYNAILSIDIPIYHNLLEKENFGTNIIYQYDASVTSLSNINTSSIIDAEKQIYLIGGEDVKFKDINYTDPGYYVVDRTSGTTITDKTTLDSLVKVTGEVGNEVGKTYYLVYTIYDMNNSIMSQATRKITVVASEYNYSYNASTVTLNIPVSGTYKIEVWGASGGGSYTQGGKGGYTTGEYALTTSDILYITVGGEGKTSSNAAGGYNGGGKAGTGATSIAGSGGGASDVRLNSMTLASRIIVAGGGGGAGSRFDDTIKCNGGFGGGTTGGIGTCSAASYVGGAGTQTSAGAAATYTDGVTTLPTSGASGTGGNGGTYTNGTSTYAGGGGGGGYYGGGGGIRYGGGGGGSAYCNSNVKSCVQKSGDETFTSFDGKAYEIGHTGNGNVKITLISTLIS